MLELIEDALDEVPLPVKSTINGALNLVVALRWDMGAAALGFDQVDQRLPVVSPVADKSLSRRQSLKTKGSRRRVPLHPKVIEAGFLVYVAALRKRGETGVFPDLLRDPRGKTTAAWSKWWGRYTAKIGIIDPRKVFHSFRHTLKDPCRAAGIEEAIHDALTGHAAPHVGRSYGKGYSLALLAEAVGRVEFGISLIASP